MELEIALLQSDPGGVPSQSGLPPMVRITSPLRRPSCAQEELGLMENSFTPWHCWWAISTSSGHPSSRRLDLRGFCSEIYSLVGTLTWRARRAQGLQAPVGVR